MSSKPLTEKQREGGPVCANCGQPKQEHRLANYADAPMIGGAFLVCPSATWKEGERTVTPCPNPGLHKSLRAIAEIATEIPPGIPLPKPAAHDFGSDLFRSVCKTCGAVRLVNGGTVYYYESTSTPLNQWSGLPPFKCEPDAGRAALKQREGA